MTLRKELYEKKSREYQTQAEPANYTVIAMSQTYGLFQIVVMVFIN
jgi:hypothetical protein